jgi:hypothetical protein
MRSWIMRARKRLPLRVIALAVESLPLRELVVRRPVTDGLEGVTGSSGSMSGTAAMTRTVPEAARPLSRGDQRAMYYDVVIAPPIGTA